MAVVFAPTGEPYSDFRWMPPDRSRPIVMGMAQVRRAGIQRLRSPTAVDVTVAAGLLAIAVLVGRVAPGGLDAGVTRALDLTGILLLAGMTLPLTVRRCWPVPVTVMCVGCCIAGAMRGYPIGVGAFGAILSLGSLAYMGSRRTTLALGVPVGVALVAGSSLAPQQSALVSVSSDLLVVGLTLLAGDLLRCRDAQQALLVRRHQELQQLREAETTAAVAEERMRIARDIHDAVGHGLVAITLQARAGKRRLNRAPERVGEALDQIDSLATRALGETRSAVAAVRAADRQPPDMVEPQPTLEALRALADSTRHPGLDISLRIDPAAHHVPFHLQLNAYRIVQESLSNAARHSRAAHVRAWVRCRDACLVIDVTDDGVTSTSSAPGSGILGMRERAAQCGGNLEAGPLPRGGWQVRASLPLGRLAG